MAETDLDPRWTDEQIRQTWQYRALAHAKDVMHAVVLSVLGDNWPDAVEVLTTMVYGEPPPYQPPFICTSAKIEKNGGIYATYVDRCGRKWYRAFFTSENHCQGTFRRLADELKLTDAERVAMFAAVRKWIVADCRLDPTFDRRDPDAKRLTVH